MKGAIPGKQCFVERSKLAEIRPESAQYAKLTVFSIK